MKNRTSGNPKNMDLPWIVSCDRGWPCRPQIFVWGGVLKLARVVSCDTGKLCKESEMT